MSKTQTPVYLGSDAIKAFAQIHGVTPQEFVKNASDNVMAVLPADNEDCFAIVQLNQCEWKEVAS